MASQLEVGLFVDFENIRYGLLNHYGAEPDPQSLMEKARKYGPVAVAYAYADYTQHPPLYRRKLEVAGISPRDVPRRSPDVPHKSSADMAMLMDIIDCLLDRPNVNTLILMTGDSDFIRVTARARHRFGKQVVIAGVPGSVSSDLVESADIYDPLGDDLEPLADGDGGHDDQRRLLELVLWLHEHRPYMTFGFIRSHALSPHHGLGLSEERVTELLGGFKETGILVESYRPSEDGRNLRTLELNVEHPQVTAYGDGELPDFEEGGRAGAAGGGSHQDAPPSAGAADDGSGGGGEPMDRGGQAENHGDGTTDDESNDPPEAAASSANGASGAGQHNTADPTTADGVSTGDDEAATDDPIAGDEQDPTTAPWPQANAEVGDGQ